MEPEPEPAGEPTLTAPHSAEEGVPPGEGDEAALRAELATLKKGALNRRARQAGVEADILDDADDADDPRAEIIELIIKAKAAAAEAAEDDCVTLQKTSSRDERARVEQMLRKFQLQADPDIRERLEKGEWKRLKRTPSRWWQTDMADRVNRLRAAARIRSSLPDDTRAEIPNLYPQLVVLGDGNTGKSTVLNRFAEFSFSAVSDGVCTRRPVRLQLRPVRAENRMRMHDENLLALCQMEDTVDNFKAEYPLRKAEREEDEDSLRCVVETRASAQAVQDGTAAAFDAQYIMEELVITIEADQMIYFDLVDLPGLDNISTMPEKMANKYINPETLPRTFVLIFAQHKKGDTQLMHSLAFRLLKSVKEELGSDEAWKELIDTRCLGLLTKVDKELEPRDSSSAIDYNRKAAKKLRESLMCEEHPSHLDRWPWVAVLNPNPNEQLQNMSFDTACVKEKWFFDELFKDDPETRDRCGVDKFRDKLVEMYEGFVASQIKRAAPKVFDKVCRYGNRMRDDWAWEAQQECYENKQKMMDILSQSINDVVNIGKTTSEPTTVVDILLRQDVRDCIERCRKQIDPASALENSKMDLLKTMAEVSAKLIEQVHIATTGLKYKRFVTMGEHVVKVMVYVARQFLDTAEREMDAVIAQQVEQYQQTPLARRPIQEMVASLLSCAKTELTQFAQLVEDLPTLPPRYIALDPPDFLEHARPKTVTLTPPFGFACDANGLVTTIADSEHCTIEPRSTIVQIDDMEFSQSAMLELSSGTRPVCFAYSVPDRSVIADDLDQVTKWLYHHKHVSHEYLEQRERFLCHRRAAEIMAMVFDEESMGGDGEPIQERAQFETMQGGRQLVCLDPGGDSDWYAHNYHGGRPSFSPTGSQEMGLQIELPGMCCTLGCTQTHDTAFNPCGHTVCCWECASRVDECPVCGIDLTCHTGIREPRDLCYDHPPTEADHISRVSIAQCRDVANYQAAKDGYEKLFVAFIVPDSDPAAAWAALEVHRQDLLAKPHRLKDQPRLWPYFLDVVHEKEAFEKQIRDLTQQHEDAMAAVRAQAAAELAAKMTEMQTAVAQQASQNVKDRQQQKRNATAAAAAAAATATSDMLGYAMVLEAELARRDARIRFQHRFDAEACNACNTTFGMMTRKHHCLACAGIFCNDCAPGGGRGFAFESSESKGKENCRVCEECREQLITSHGVRSRNIPAQRPDGSRFGSDRFGSDSV